MTVALLELFVASAMIYAGVRCRGFVKLLAGQDTPGTHCTGSLIAVIGGLIGYELTGGLTGVLEALAAALGLTAAARAAKGSKSPTPSPSPLPSPTPSPLPGPSPLPLPPGEPTPGGGFEVSTGTGQPQGGYQVLQAVPVSAQTFQALSGLQV